jgi:hypothetical protein
VDDRVVYFASSKNICLKTTRAPDLSLPLYELLVKIIRPADWAKRMSKSGTFDVMKLRTAFAFFKVQPRETGFFILDDFTGWCLFYGNAT